MICKTKKFFWNKYILFFVTALIICCTCMMIAKNQFLKLKKWDYISIESNIGYEFSTNNPEKISGIVEIFNNKFYKTFKWVDTLASPEIVMTLVKKDGTIENIEIYGGAWKEGLFLLYNDAQYQTKNSDKFYESIKNVFQ